MLIDFLRFQPWPVPGIARLQQVASAMDIGMLPRMPVERVRQVGNAAGVGARLALVDTSQRERAVAIAERVKYVELMVQADFATRFARAMFLP